VKVLNGGVSYWYASTGLPAYRGALPGDQQADVCIVGAGLTGLWTAYYLKREQPDLRIVVLEKEFAGFGASGATAAGSRPSSRGHATPTRRPMAARASSTCSPRCAERSTR
jgi:hypothetical protein